MTRAITYANAGDPADVLEVTEIPDPPTPGPGQIQVEVRAFPIHPGGLVGVRLGPPRPGQRTVAGLDATGVVVATGPGVDAPTVGTRVTVFPNPGSWAQRINVAAEVAVPVPDSVSDDVAAQMVCNPLTALLLYRAAQQHFSVGFDGIIINNAANSSVGRLFTASADHHQIATVSVVRSADRARELVARYPNVPVVSTDSPDWVQQIRAIAGCRPIPVALDSVGGTIAGHLISLLSAGGTLITYGAMAQENIPLRAQTYLAAKSASAD
jgi:NADPH:quinone reductase-like Zn-dependent oxidoreductase